MNVLMLGFNRDLLNPDDDNEDVARLGWYAQTAGQIWYIVHAIGSHWLERKMGELIAVPTCGRTRIHSLMAMVRIGIRLHREFGIDLIQSQEPAFTGVAGLMLKWRLRRPLNVCVFGPNPYDPDYVRDHRWLTPLAKRVLKGADMIQVDGLRHRRLLLEAGFPEARVAYKPIVPVDINRFQRPSGRDRAIALRMLFVGRLAAQKDPDLCLDVLQRVLVHVPNVRLTIAGDGPLRLALQTRVRQAGLEHAVEFAGHVGRSDLPELFWDASLLLLTSRYEGYPRVLMEAAFAGLPVVSTSISGAEDIVISGVTGEVVDSRSAETLAATVVSLLRDPRRRKTMGDEAAAHAIEKLEPRHWMREQVAIWHRMTDVHMDDRSA